MQPAPRIGDEFQRDGVAVIRNLLTSAQVEKLRSGVAANQQKPGPYASHNEKEGECGLFFDDYCNWTRIDEFREVLQESKMAQTAAWLMKSNSAQFFHDHVLVKEPGTTMATPWHSDGPYYFVQGNQTVSFWIPLDQVSKETSLRCVAHSHRWNMPILPTRWVSQEPFFSKSKIKYLPAPDPELDDKMRILEYDLEPGDAVAFSFDTLHGARGNLSSQTRRVVSFRFVGDDARYIQRSGPTSPPFPNHGMQSGDMLRTDWFPVMFTSSSSSNSSTEAESSS